MALDGSKPRDLRASAEALSDLFGLPKLNALPLLFWAVLLDGVDPEVGDAFATSSVAMAGHDDGFTHVYNP